MVNVGKYTPAPWMVWDIDDACGLTFDRVVGCEGVEGILSKNYPPGESYWKSPIGSRSLRDDCFCIFSKHLEIRSHIRSTKSQGSWKSCKKVWGGLLGIICR